MNGTKWSQALTTIAGGFYTAVALVMLAQPEWFYQTIGNFPPFNRHYIGDTATFTLPIGIGLMWAGRDLERYRSLLAAGLAASLLHAGNHVVDAAGEPLTHWLLDVAPLSLLTASLVAVWLARRGEQEVI